MSSSFWQHWEACVEKDRTMDSSRESTPKRLQGQRRPARHRHTTGASSSGDQGKLSIESPRASKRRWLVPFVLCCSVAALFLAWYIPYWFPGWYSTTTRWLDAHRLFAIVLSILLLAFLLFWFLLWKLPQWQVAAVPEMKDRIDLESKSRQTLAQILGGAALLVGLYFTSQTLRTTQEGQITDRFTKAITQLGDTNLAVRLGGIYALERIARDSEQDHWAVMEVLTAFVREYSHGSSNPPWAWVSRLFAKDQSPQDRPESKPPTDIQAILTVVRRRTRTFGNGETQRLDLRNADLQGADLAGAQLQGVLLVGAQLQRADLAGAQLYNAILGRAQLQRAFMPYAQLSATNLMGAQLQDTYLVGAQLQGAYLDGAQLQGADLERVELQRAWLRGADLTAAKNLTQDQINTTCLDEHTKLPTGLTRPAPCHVEP
jgi:hypothetical protein